MAVGVTAGVEYTIDELARAAGTTVRSVRVYHERGILPPPLVKGRTGYYGPDHLNRVRTISRLLERGIKLNGIRELLNAWGRGDDLSDVLGEPAAATEATETATTIGAAELVERYAEIPNGLARVVTAGLYEPIDAATYRIVDQQLIRVVDQLAAAAVPPAEVLTELESLRLDADRVARRFVDLFRRTALARYEESDRDTAAVTALAERLAALRGALSEATAELVNRSVARYLGQEAELAVALSEAEHDDQISTPS